MSTLTDAAGKTSRKIELGGRTWNVKDFSLNDLCSAEEKLGEDSTQWAGLKAVRYLVWLKLVKEEPEITEEEVGEMITVNDMDAVNDIIGLAPNEEEQDDSNKE
jgi:hypothetical protein